VIRTKPDSGIRQKSMSVIPSTRPSITVVVPSSFTFFRVCSTTSVLAAFFAKTSAFLAGWTAENKAQL